MKFELSDSFAHFFARYGLIEFEDVFPEKDLKQLSLKLKTALEQSPEGKPLTIASNADIWLAGRNLWMKDPSILKLLTKSPVGAIASFLFKKKPLRLGYTQTILANASDTLPAELKTLDQIGSLTPVLGGALLCFESSIEEEEKDLPDLEKIRSGRIIFFSSEQTIPLPSLLGQKDLHCLLLCFAPQKVRYKLQPSDVHTHTLKKSGYVFGDLVGEKEIPYLVH